MKAIFKNKPLTVMLLALTLILVILISVLMVQLTQLTSLSRQVAYYNQLREEIGAEINDRQDFLEFKQTYQYIYEHATEWGLGVPTDAQWIWSGN